jgi:hypothetical protein
MLSQLPEPYAPVIIKLLKGVIYADDIHWHILQNYLTPIRDYFAKIGIEVHNYETDGFAYLTQPKEIEIDERKESLPRLTSSHKFSLKMTILCVLLRLELQQFDASEKTGKPIISIAKIRELVQPYFPATNNEDKLRKEIDTLVDKVCDLKILRELSGQDGQYEIMRIIKAKINTEVLNDLKQKLEQYVTTTVSSS